MIGTNVDVSKYVELQEELEQSFIEYRAFIKQSSMAKAMLNSDMEYIAVSEKWLLDYDLNGKDVIGKSHLELFPLMNEEWKQVYNDCLRGDVQRSDKSSFVAPNGKTRFLRWDVRPWRDSKGIVGGLILYTEDITESVERRAESERKELDHGSERTTSGPGRPNARS